MILLKRYFAILVIALTSPQVFAQAPNISYSPSSNTLTLNTAFSISPSNSGGAVPALSYGTGIQLTGATLNNPWGMGIDPSGNIYVVNYNAGNYNASSVSKYNSAGVYQGTFGTSANLQQPAGIVFDASGNGYVLNYNRTNNGLGNDFGNGYIDQYNSSGVYQSTIVQGLGTATGIAIDATNNLYVAEGVNNNNGNNTASQYSTAGALAFSIASGYTANPVAVGVDGSYNIYVLDNANKNVTKYNSSGVYVSTPVTGLSNPKALYVDGAGDIYVGDSGTQSVTVYNSSGTLLATITGLTDPRGLVTDKYGNLYVSDYTNNTVTKFAPASGYFISGPLPQGLSFSTTTGAISGTPAVPFSATTYTVTAYNLSGSSSTTITLYCPPIASAPSITYNPAINVLTIGTAASLAPTNTGGTPTGYAISPTTMPAGLSFNTSTGVISGTPTTKTSATVYTVTATNSYGSSTAKVSIACVVDNYWTGSKSNDWNTKQNWSANRVPTSTDLASVGVINYTGYDPTVSANTTAYYVTFGAANAATLTVNSGYTFTINNILTVNTNAAPTFTGSGTVGIASSGVVYVNGTGAITINASTTFTLQSGSTSSASVAEITSGLIDGNVTVQRYIPGGSGYRGYILLSSPVNYGTADSYGNSNYSINYLLNSTYITGTNFTTTTFSKSGNPSLYLYRENLVPSNSSFTSGNFRGISDISASPNYTLNNDGSGFGIPAGNGYLMFFRGGTGTVNPYSTSSTPAPATLSATGKLNQGAITVKHWYTPGTSALMYTTVSGTANIEGFNLVGNPYACTIDLSTYASGGIAMTNLSKYVYELDPVSKNYGIYALDGSISSTNHASQYIVSGQGFFVQALSASPTPQLTFNESCKVENVQNTGTSLLLGKPLATNNIQCLRLKMSMDSVNADETVIGFSGDAQTASVANEDAPYRAGTGKVTLSSISADNKSLAINKLPLSDGLTIPLKVGASAYGSYALSLAEVKAIPQVFDIWLKDSFTGDSVNMRTNAIYNFAITTDTSSHGTKRFSIVMRENPAMAYQLLTFTAGKINNNKQTQLNWTTKNEENYTSFTLERSTDGEVTFNVIDGLNGSGAGAYGFVDKTPASGANYYRLKQEDINGAITYSKVIQVMYVNTEKAATADLLTYPNPVKNTLNLLIKPKTAQTTNYSILITNASGLIMRQSTTSQPQWQGDVNSFLPGTYIVQVVDNTSKDVIGRARFVKL